MNYQKFSIIICIFLFLSITPVSASLQSDLNATKTGYTENRNSLANILKNNTTQIDNKKSLNNSINKNESLGTSIKEEEKNVQKINDILIDGIKNELKGGIIIKENDTLLGTLITITNINDLKVGDIIGVSIKLNDLKNKITQFILLTKISGAADDDKNYTYVFIDPTNTAQYTTKTISSDKFKELVGNITSGLVVFRLDPSIVGNITPNDEEIKILESFGVVNDKIDNEPLIKPTEFTRLLDDIGKIMGYISTPMTLIGIPITALGIIIGPSRVQKILDLIRFGCCLENPDKVSEKLAKEAAISEKSVAISLELFKLNGEIRIIKEQKRYLDEKLAEAIYKNNKHDVEQIKLEIKLLETKQQTAKSLRDVYKFKAETLRPIKEAQLSVQTETSPLIPLAPKSPYDSTPSDALFQD